MATTNFAALTTEQKKTWSRDVWKTARQNSFVMQLAGKGMNAPISRVTELKRTEKGTLAVLTLVPDLTGDGVMGDNTLEGNEEAAKAYDLVVEIDQIRNANKLAGRIADQKSIVDFRETSRDILGFWAADRLDQLAMLTMSGVDYRLQTDGKIRTGFTHDGANYARTAAAGTALYDLAFQARLTKPSTKRYFRWNATTGKLVAGIATTVLGAQTNAADSPTTVLATDTPSYKMLVELHAYAKQRRLRPIRVTGGVALYHVLMHPQAVAKLKLDADFLANLRNAGARGASNPLFSGALVTVDGLVIHENIHVFNTLGATTGAAGQVGRPGYKWGANADVDGSRTLILGAQALGFADIGIPEWVERNHFDYGNQLGISINKIVGFLKPQFKGSFDDEANLQDYGVICVDHSL